MSAAMERPGQTRERAKSTFSLKSDKSRNSSHKHERHLSESAEEKRRNHLTATTKANPNAAMNEAQPIAAALEKPTLQSLRSFQHTDRNGVPIAEPDLSNPTRSRWERPLDTIRSFEAAIDSEYKRRAQTQRPDAGSEIMSAVGSRRSSYYGGAHEQNRFSQAHHYNRSGAQTRDSWIDNSSGVGGPVGPPRSRYNRNNTDPGNFNRYSNAGHGVYPTQGHQQSRDTVNTGGSGSQSDPYSTDPSSDNSSIERATPVGGEAYGFQGFGASPIMEEYSNGSGPSYGHNGYPQQQQQQQHQHQHNGYPQQQQQYNGGPPPVPRKAGPPAPPQHNPNMIKLSQTNSQGQGAAGAGKPNVLQRQQSTDKRKSWFKRRFSKE